MEEIDISWLCGPAKNSSKMNAKDTLLYNSKAIKNQQLKTKIKLTNDMFVNGECAGDKCCFVKKFIIILGFLNYAYFNSWNNVLFSYVDCESMKYDKYEFEICGKFKYRYTG